MICLSIKWFASYITNMLKTINFCSFWCFWRLFEQPGTAANAPEGIEKKFGEIHTTFTKFYMIWDAYLMCWSNFTSYITNMLKTINFCSFWCFWRLFEQPGTAANAPEGIKKKFGATHTTFTKFYIIWDAYLMWWPFFTSYFHQYAKIHQFLLILEFWRTLWAAVSRRRYSAWLQNFFG